MPSAELPACVFCGEPIGPAEEAAGRAPMAAHATCADAALADDTHWDAIDAARGEPEPAAVDEDARPPSAAGRSGCLVIALSLTVVLLAAAMLPA